VRKEGSKGKSNALYSMPRTFKSPFIMKPIDIVIKGFK